jgi:hypothetical protein
MVTVAQGEREERGRQERSGSSCQDSLVKQVHPFSGGRLEEPEAGHSRAPLLDPRLA